jgi:hypothetical protein
MKPSRSFLAALLTGFVLVLALRIAAFCLNLGVPSDLSRWASDIYDKKLLLANEAGPGKLLLVGGSATLFGVRAKQIEALTGHRTINFADHAAFGVDYILYKAKQVAKPGDTVLLILEYELYNSGELKQSWVDQVLVDYLVARDPGYLRSRPLAEQWTIFMLMTDQRLVRGLKYRLRHGLTEGPEQNEEGPYHVRCIDDWGDQTCNMASARPKDRSRVWSQKSVLGEGLPVNPKGAAAIEAFCQWAKANHIRVLATFPNLCYQPEYYGEAAKRAITTITNLYCRLGVPVVGNYTEVILPPDQFFDTCYHLTAEAAQARSQLLAGELIPFLK